MVTTTQEPKDEYISHSIQQIEGTLGLEDLIDKVTIRTIEGIRPAAINMHHIAAARGMRVALCADISSGKPMVDAEGAPLNTSIFGWNHQNEKWWKDPELALHSPIPRACRYESEPFWCNNDGFHGITPNRYLDEIDINAYFSSIHHHQLALLVVPVHLPFGQISANSFPSLERKSKNLTVEFEKYGTLMGALTRRLISGYVSVMDSASHIPSDCGLSKREAECIKWASFGKTDEEIGTILSVCRSTVRYHIKRAGEKLSSVNRTQTVFRASQLGYLGSRH